MVLMAKNFNKMLKRVEKNHNRPSQRLQGRDCDRSSQNSRSDSNQGNRRKDLQCHECEGFGHYRNECPLTKRKELKCIECRGYGHTRSECPNNLKKDKSLICFSDTESDEDSESEELVLNFSAHVDLADEPQVPPICNTVFETESSCSKTSGYLLGGDMVARVRVLVAVSRSGNVSETGTARGRVGNVPMTFQSKGRRQFVDGDGRVWIGDVSETV
ncbi:hypothetical protein Bca4012_036953 [Brassica carinata]